MTDTIHLLIEKYGLLAIFLGSLGEGESAAILGGFFAHQNVFVFWHAYVAALLGAFLGDTTFFSVGRYFSDRPFVMRLRQRPGFSHAYELVQSHPNLFILSNRYIYGFRLVGGVAAGLSGISPVRFVILNFLSALVWAALFCGIGYVFGLGAEQIIGQKLLKHERLLIALGGGIVIALSAWLIARHFARKAARKEQA